MRNLLLPRTRLLDWGFLTAARAGRGRRRVVHHGMGQADRWYPDGYPKWILNIWHTELNTRTSLLPRIPITYLENIRWDTIRFRRRKVIRETPTTAFRCHSKHTESTAQQP